MINEFPISEALAKSVASDINKTVRYSEASVVGRGDLCFVKVVRQFKGGRGPTSITQEVTEMFGRKQERRKR